jgi:PAS domain S-box-containing protein
MKDKLKMLLLEDLPTDADIINRTLIKNELNFKLLVVDNKPDFVREVADFNPDLILSDYSLPQYSGLEALHHVLSLSYYIPFIIVTGSINEDTAVECIKQGATDYVTKENLVRLGPAITAALDKKETMLKKEEAERALQESERRFRHSFDHANVGMCLIDLNDNILQANPKLSQILGYSKAELKKANIYDITHPDDIESSKKVHSNCISGESETAEFEMRYIHKNGNIVWVHISLSLIKDSQEEPLYFISHILDISQRKESENEIRKLFLAVEQSPSIVCITDIEGRIEYVNHRFLEVTGYAFKEVHMENPRILKSGEMEPGNYEELWKTITAGRIWKGEFHNKKKNGEYYWALASIAPLKDEKGNITHFVAMQEDITLRKEMERDLIRAKEKAEESDRLKSSFLATISHELRTPLNAIIGFSELLLRGESNVHDKVLDYTQIIFDSGKNLLGIINDIFDISMIEANEVKIYPELFSVNKLFEEIRNNFKNNTEVVTKNLTLTFLKNLNDDEDMVLTDRVKFNRVLTNLISNAIKFTDRGEIDVGYNIKNVDHALWLEFYVKDTGIGIPEDKTELIFERFRQVDDTNTRRFGGSGLGLSIAKKIIELLGGKIWVNSELDKGSTFYFTLPFSATNLQNEEINTGSTEALINWNAKTVLIVEDVEMNYLYIDEILEDTGINRLWAKTGNEALQLFKQHNDKLDIILMDIMLPDIDGYQVTKQIRIEDVFIPIIAQTAFALSGDQEKAIDAGCNDYIPKPINQGNLIKLMGKYLNIKKQ